MCARLLCLPLGWGGVGCQRVPMFYLLKVLSLSHASSRPAESTTTFCCICIGAVKQTPHPALAPVPAHSQAQLQVQPHVISQKWP